VTLQSYINNIDTVKFPELPQAITHVLEELLPVLESVAAPPSQLQLCEAQVKAIEQQRAIWDNELQILLDAKGKDAPSKATISAYLDSVEASFGGEWRCALDASDLENPSNAPLEHSEVNEANDANRDEEHQRMANSLSHTQLGFDDIYTLREWATLKLESMKERLWTDFAETQALQLRGRRIQVIVKAANIVLKPSGHSVCEYSGGSWHVEGMSHEHIVASAIWYYDAQGVSPSFLKFRKQMHEPMLGQDPPSPLLELFDVQDGDPLHTELGAVCTSVGSCVAFPNSLQHQVQRFRILPGAAFGERKILCFFIVDPEHRIVSTEHVYPQDPVWMTAQVVGFLVNHIPVRGLCELVAEYEARGMSLKLAHEVRQELMRERKFYTRNQNDEFERTFSLCEH
jgi:hypothetical protein